MTEDRTTAGQAEPDADDDLATVVERPTPHSSPPPIDESLAETAVGQTPAAPMGSAPTLPGGNTSITEALTRARSRLSLSSDTSAFTLAAGDLATRTLIRDELLRSRSLGFIGVTLSVLIAIAIPFLDGDTTTTALALTSCAIAAVANAFLIVLCRDPNHYRPGALAVVWLSASFAIGTGVSFFGIYSAAPLAATLGIYFVALGNSRWLAYAVWLVLSLTIGGVALVSLLGVIDDPGLITADSLPVKHRALLAMLLQGMLLGVFILGRHSRVATVAAVSELERATRALGQREALLDEARLELRAALAAGGAGPWSGRELGGYLIGQLLGRGGMGEVYEAIGSDDNRVAIKLLTPASALDGKIVERFRREAEITAALDSNHIVKVHAISEPGAAVPFLVMERLAGYDLAEILRKKTLLEKKALARMIEQVASGLEVARGVGVVHRDIKPQNLFASDERSGRVWKILDFGVSKLGEHSGTLTQGKVVGTPAYMAPEQAKGLDDVGPAADAYALAAIAYRCLTGRPPFRGKSTAALLYNVVHEMPVRPSSLVRVSSATDAALALGMAKDPDRRTSTAGEFARVFIDALEGREESTPELAARAHALELESPWRET